MPRNPYGRHAAPLPVSETPAPAGQPPEEAYSPGEPQTPPETSAVAPAEQVAAATAAVLPEMQAAEEQVESSFDTFLKSNVRDMARTLRESVPNEPPGGYWQQYAGYHSREDREALGAVKEAAVQDAHTRNPETYTTLDKYVLDIREKGAKPLPEQIFDSLTDQTGQAPKIEDLVGNVYELEKLARLFVLEGRVDHNFSPNGEGRNLMQAAEIMTQATRKVRGFDPLRSGLAELTDWAIWHRAVLDVELPHRLYGRTNARGGKLHDPASLTVGTCMQALKEMNKMIQLEVGSPKEAAEATASMEFESDNLQGSVSGELNLDELSSEGMIRHKREF